jgi:hypothetical protein
MSALRYLLRSVGFALLRGSRLTPRYVATLVGRAIGGVIAGRFTRRLTPSRQ